MFRIVIQAIIINISIYVLLGCGNEQPFCRKEGQSLQEYFAWNANKVPRIMAHRMAPPSQGYAENSLKALDWAYSKNPCFIQELDVRMSKDSVLLLLHDSTLDRTTTGSGYIHQMLYRDIQKLSLKDELGSILHGQQVPTLREILRYAHGKMILALDMKRGTDPDLLMKEVVAAGSIKDVFVICYTVKDAIEMNRKYPNLMLALGFNSWENINAIEKSGLPFKNLIALTPGKLQEKKFYDKIHSMGISTSFGAFGEVDRFEFQFYKQQIKTAIDCGVDIICTDSLGKIKMAFPAF